MEKGGSSGLGLLGFDSFHFLVSDFERSHQFYTKLLDWPLVARSGKALTERSGQQSNVYAANEIRVVVSTPMSDRGRAATYLRNHPDGVSSISFRVRNLDRTWDFLAPRGATFLSDIETFHDARGATYRRFLIATPLGDVAYRFVERRNFEGFAPEFDDLPREEAAGAPANRLGFQILDHITSNTQTMTPVVLWYREVLGFEEYWNIQFHTEDVKKGQRHGSGLKSIVMWDPSSELKFATNEPLKPFFRESQINIFTQENRGAGVQHIALRVPEIIPVVDEMRRRGVRFLDAPDSYYDNITRWLSEKHVTRIREPLEDLRRLNILADGEDEKYLLQIFMRDGQQLWGDPKAGPFFYEVIQREGDPGFGYGNFRALFESIEKQQKEGEHPTAETVVPEPVSRPVG
jgi:4-hydroxyphenylpyruvate dioxygenase